MKRTLVPLAVYLAMLAVVGFVAWIVGSWWVALGGIGLVTVLAELVWWNWWGTHHWRKRDADGG
jgi:hypothetical protein